MSEASVDHKHRAAGVKWRIAITGGLLSLCVLSTVRIASGAFEAESVPVADISAQNGMVTGTLRMMGDRFLLYNGTRLESMTQSMKVNFERGGSMVLCPRSQLQILSANANTGMMLAFQSGGAQQPFPIQMGDEVLTPDWRVELTSDARKGDMGVVQVVTNRHGDLCLQGNSQLGAYFRVSQLIGDASFHVESGQSERFSDGRMESSSEACGCDAAFVAKADAAPAVGGGVPAPEPKTAAIISPNEGRGVAPVPALSAEAPRASDSAQVMTAHPQEVVDAKASPAVRRPRQRPQDVAGYVRSFVRLVFGR
jgi:hypothetical protein